MKRMKSPIQWFGGKQRMLPHILPLVPDHTVYVEPFFGGGSLYFAKDAAQVEVINDLNKEVVNFYRIIKQNPEQLKEELEYLLHSRESFVDAQTIYGNSHLFTEMQRAVAFYILANQSYSATMTQFGYSKSTSKATSIKSKINRLDVKELSQRLGRTTLESDDACKVIGRYDNPEAFFYLDPPYFNARVEPYFGKYTEADYRQLLELLSDLEGKFLLSGYNSEILDRFIKREGWDYKTVERKVNINHRKTVTKTEILVWNYQLRTEPMELPIIIK